MIKLFDDRTSAAAAGYETFNEGQHLAVDIPAEGCFTITARTSTGKLVTFCFVGGASCVDLRYHNSDLPKVVENSKFMGEPEIFQGKGEPTSTFHMIGFTKGGPNSFDTRRTLPVSLATILL